MPKHARTLLIGVALAILLYPAIANSASVKVGNTRCCNRSTTPFQNPGAVVVDVGFQVTFAIITTALISGALAERVRVSTWLVFTALWVTLAYFPLAHQVWGGG